MFSIFQLNRSGVHHKQSTLSRTPLNLLFRPKVPRGYQPSAEAAGESVFGRTIRSRIRATVNHRREDLTCLVSGLLSSGGAPKQ